jgi:hypothetical protein
MSHIPQKSGANWGGANAHVNPGDSYIPIRQNNLIAAPQLFPTVDSGRISFDVTWDDGERMKCSFEATQNFNGAVYPKQIASDGDKSVLGDYLRKRMGIPSGQPISDDDFDRYGRDNIDITKNDDGTFFFDFSVPSKLH